MTTSSSAFANFSASASFIIYLPAAGFLIICYTKYDQVFLHQKPVNIVDNTITMKTPKDTI